MSSRDPEREDKAERLLSEAVLWRTRGVPEKAEALCLEAIAIYPEDPNAHELHGDMLQLLGEIEKAQEEYKETLRLSPHKPSAETKYAQGILALAAEKERKAVLESKNPDAILKMVAAETKKSNPTVSFIYSLIIPGTGQIHNGVKEKGYIILGIWAVLLMIFLFPIVELILQDMGAGNYAQSTFWGSLGLLLICGIDIYSAVEAFLTAQK